MQWNSVGDFFAMGGYALYVWSAMALTFASIGIELIWVALRARSIRALLAGNRVRKGGQQ